MAKIKTRLDEIIKNSDEVTKNLLSGLQDTDIPKDFDLLEIVNKLSKDTLDSVMEKSKGNDTLGVIVLLGLIRVYADMINSVVEDNSPDTDYPSIYM